MSSGFNRRTSSESKASKSTASNVPKPSESNVPKPSESNVPKPPELQMSNLPSSGNLIPLGLPIGPSSAISFSTMIYNGRALTTDSPSTELLNAIHDVSAANRVANMQLVNLQHENALLRQENAALLHDKQMFGNLASQMNALQVQHAKELEDRAKEKQVLENLVKEIRTDHDREKLELEKLVSDLREENERLKAENQKLKLEIEQLKKTVSTHEQTIGEHEQTIAEHERTIGKLENTVGYLRTKDKERDAKETAEQLTMNLGQLVMYYFSSIDDKLTAECKDYPNLKRTYDHKRRGCEHAEMTSAERAGMLFGEVCKLRYKGKTSEANEELEQAAAQFNFPSARLFELAMVAKSQRNGAAHPQIDKVIDFLRDPNVVPGEYRPLVEAMSDIRFSEHE